MPGPQAGRRWTRREIVDKDGISRLTLTRAYLGEREKGERDPAVIAANIVELYRDEWLDRELAKRLPLNATPTMKKTLIHIREIRTGLRAVA